MKALTVQQPWATAIVMGIKDVENRTWPTEYRGKLVIHAGKTDWPHWLPAALLPLGPVAALPHGCIVGVVDLDDCVRAGDIDSEWESGPWCWVLKNPMQFHEPVIFRGHQGLWDAPTDVIRAIMERQ